MPAFDFGDIAGRLKNICTPFQLLMCAFMQVKRRRERGKMDYAVPEIYKKLKTKNAVVCVPGSKSITARALLLAALAQGTSTLYGAGLSDDCLTFIDCIKSLGVNVSVSGSAVTVEGCGGRFPVKKGVVYVGSAGTAARFITAALALSPGEYTVDCSPQMKSRPIDKLLRALADLGAKFDFIEKEGCFPFKVRGTASPAGQVTVDVGASSQFLSALLMAAPLARNGLKISVLGSHGMKYVDMTADMMWSFGVDVSSKDGVYAVPSGARYSARKYDVEPDISAACYFYAANRILGSNISVRGVAGHSAQGDIKFIELMRGGFDGGEIDMSDFSDQALTMAAIAPYFSKPTRICGINHIRGQECDRIAAIEQNLAAMGVKCEVFEGGVTVFPSAPRPARIKTFGDHRVAMSFAVTGLKADGIVIENAEVCSKTFPQFFAVLDGVAADLTK